MEELITTIYEITVKMNHTLTEENYEEFGKLLNERKEMMATVDNFRSDHPDYQHTPKAKRLLTEVVRLDQRFTPLLNENITKTKNSINQMKKNKQVSKKYQSYIKQTNGVFVDAKK